MVWPKNYFFILTTGNLKPLLGCNNGGSILFSFRLANRCAFGSMPIWYVIIVSLHNFFWCMWLGHYSAYYTSFFFFFRLFKFLSAPQGMWDLSFTQERWNPQPLWCRHWVLTTGPPGKPKNVHILANTHFLPFLIKVILTGVRCYPIMVLICISLMMSEHSLALPFFGIGMKTAHNWVTELNWTEWWVMLNIFPCTS